MIRLSAVIITLNEEKKLPACLASVRPVADEMVVLDSFSEDRTRHIAREMGARVQTRRFEGYVEQKRAAVDLARFDWVLSLDADEVLSERLAEGIRSFKKAPEAPGCTMNRLTHYGNRPVRHCGWYPDIKLRLFDRNRAVIQGQNPHDRIVLNGADAPKHLEGDLLHYSYDSVRDHLTQARRFAGIAAQQLRARGCTCGRGMPVLRPFWTFFRDYVVKAGFLDGMLGLRVCTLSAFATYLKYSTLRKMDRRER